MKLRRRNFLHLAAGAAALPTLPRVAAALDYPTRPITIVVPFSAGGPLDTLTRIVADRMRRFLGQSIVIENVTGAAGSIGTGRVARAAPDGYTLLAGIWSTSVVNPVVYALPYDVINDFAPVALMADNPQIIVGRKGLPADDLKGLIAWLKANPDKGLAGTAGVGSPQHVFGVFFEQATDTRFQFVHYRGAAPAMQELVAGRLDFIISDQVTALPQISTGAVKAYAVTTKTRLAGAPDVPTVDDAGLPTFHTRVWNAIWAPKGTSQSVIVKLNSAIIESLDDAALRARLDQLGEKVVPREQQTPEVLAALLKAETEKWWPIIKAAGIKAE
jgi:tripartite-type tricarboxylate transporter receptor subunit TctC